MKFKKKHNYGDSYSQNKTGDPTFFCQSFKQYMYIYTYIYMYIYTYSMYIHIYIFCIYRIRF